MAYADFTFYAESYYGNSLSEDTAARFLEQASDEIDSITWGRLATAFPTNELHISKVKKAVCAVADALFLIDTQSKAALLQKSENGYTGGVISSISSGKESVSYTTSGASASMYAAAASSAVALRELLNSIAVRYLANVPDNNGTNLLYAGGLS